MIIRYLDPRVLGNAITRMKTFIITVLIIMLHLLTLRVLVLMVTIVIMVSIA